MSACRDGQQIIGAVELYRRASVRNHRQAMAVELDAVDAWFAAFAVRPLTNINVPASCARPRRRRRSPRIGTAALSLVVVDGPRAGLPAFLIWMQDAI